MIRLEIDADGYDLDDDVRARIEEKIGGLDHYMNTLSDGHVAVAWEGGPNEATLVRAQLWGGGHHFEASDTDRDAVAAVDRTRHELEKQIRRQHDREISQRRGR